MKKIFFIGSLVTVLFTGCYKEDNEGVITNTVTLSPTNVVPAVTSSGTATFTYAYNANTRSFSYQIDYANLTDSCTQFGISKAMAGQVLPSSTFQLVNFNNAVTLQRRTKGTYTGNFIVDGFSITLDELKAGKYCVYLRRRNPAAPTTVGFEEVRGQIVF